MTAPTRTLLATLAALLLFAPAGAAQQERLSSLYRESYALEAKRDFAGAIAKMREIRGTAGPSYFVTIRVAWLSYLAGDFKAAAAGYTEAMAAEPKAIEPKLGLTLPLLAAKNWPELERACRRVLEADPHNALALSRLGQALYWGGNYTEAVSTYRRLAADYPSELDYKTGLAWALLKLGRVAEARPLFDAVLAVSPDNVNAKQGLAAK